MIHLTPCHMVYVISDNNPTWILFHLEKVGFSEIYDCKKRHSVHLYELSEIIKQQIKINLERKRKKIALLCNSK